MSVSLAKNENNNKSFMPNWAKQELTGDLQRMNHDAHCRSALLKVGVKTNTRNRIVNELGKNDYSALQEFFQNMPR